MEIDETIIIEHCQQGELEQFSQLYDQYIKKIYNFIYYKTHHKETAEDLTSLAFTKALENIKKFNNKKGTFSSWIYRIARNTVIDHYRTDKKTANIDDVWDLSDDSDFARDFDTKEKLDKIGQYLNKLTTEQRDIVIMRVWQGMSYKEIAEIMNKSESSLKMNFSRTITKLRNDMPLAIFLTLLLFDK